MSVDAWPRPPIHNNMSIPWMGDGSEEREREVWCRNEWSVSFPPFHATRASGFLTDRQYHTFIPLLSVTLLLSISIADFFPPSRFITNLYQ